MQNRRDFLKQGLMATVGISLLQNTVQAATLSNKVVVYVFLFGGNDGLNTVVPLNQYDTYKTVLRPVIGIDRARLLTLANAPDFGLNPGLASLKTLYDQGKLAIINGVSQPKDANGLYDHERCQYINQTSDVYRRTNTNPTGWLARTYSTTDPLAGPGINLGGGTLSLASPSYQPTSITNITDFGLPLRFDATNRRAAYDSLQSYAAINAVGDYNRTTRQLALVESATITARTSTYVPQVTYPTSGLGNSLKNCAQLLTGDLGIRAMTVSIGGWDTHSDQNKINTGLTIGFHENLLKNLAEALSAFYQDIQAQGLGDQVIIVTSSDFGRTPRENGTFGTDHGFSSVAFVLGKMVRGGVYNDYPSLTTLYNNQLDIKSDFRSIQSTIAARFLNLDPVIVAGGTFPLINFL